jgi:hypothetical protein
VLVVVFVISKGRSRVRDRRLVAPFAIVGALALPDVASRVSTVVGASIRADTV